MLDDRPIDDEDPRRVPRRRAAAPTASPMTLRRTVDDYGAAVSPAVKTKGKAATAVGTRRPARRHVSRPSQQP